MKITHSFSICDAELILGKLYIKKKKNLFWINGDHQCALDYVLCRNQDMRSPEFTVRKPSIIQLLTNSGYWDSYSPFHSSLVHYSVGSTKKSNKYQAYLKYVEWWKKRKIFLFKFLTHPKPLLIIRRKNPKAILYNNSVFQELERVSRELKKTVWFPPTLSPLFICFILFSP